MKKFLSVLAALLVLVTAITVFLRRVIITEIDDDDYYLDL